MNIKLINIMSLGFSLVFVFWVFWLCGAGFDITDEGFYLNSIAYSDLYQGTTSQFGTLYKPLYLLLNGNLFAMRVSNNFIIYLTTAIAFALCLNTNKTSTKLTPFDILSLSLLLATSCFLYLTFWQPTPSYNTLNIIGLNGAVIGLLWARDKPYDIAPTILLGIAGWLTFMAKPTTGACLGLFVLAFSLITLKEKRIKSIAIASITSFVLLVITALILDGNIASFMERLQTGLTRGSTLLQSKRTISSLFWNGNIKHNILIGTLTIAILTHTVVRKKTLYPSNPLTIKSISLLPLVFATAILLLATGLIPDPFNFKNTLFISTPLVYLLILLTLISLATKPNKDDKPNQHRLVVLIILLLPYAYVFGTTNNYIQISTLVIHYLIMALVLELIRGDYFKDIKIVIWLISISFFSLSMLTTFKSAQSPYRQQESVIHQKKNGVWGSDRLSSIKISASQKEYFDKLKTTLENNGYASGEPIVDFTGRSPGAVYAVGGYSLAAPWLIGGYAGSDQRVLMDLGLDVDKLLNKSWLLIEENNLRSIETDILSKLGIDFKTEFSSIGSVRSHFNSIESDETKIQQLYRPDINARQK